MYPANRKRTEGVGTAALCFLNTVATASDPILIRVAIGSQQCNTMIDTGASHSFIEHQWATRLGLSYILTDVTVSTADTTNIRIAAKVQVDLVIHERPYPMPLWVLQRAAHRIIVGRNLMSQLPLTIGLEGNRLYVGYHYHSKQRAQPALIAGHGIHFVDGTTHEQQGICDILLQHQDAVFQWSGRQGCLPKYTVTLDTTDGALPASPPFRQAPDKLAPFKEIIAEYVQAGIIEPAKSPYNSLAFLTPKKNGQLDAPAVQQWRLVEDYQKLNTLLVQDNYPMPIIRDVLTALDKAGAAINIAKSTFLATQIEFLGLIIDQTGARPAPHNLTTVEHYPCPSTTKEMQRFLGLATYLWAHVPLNFATAEKVLRTTIPAKPSMTLRWSTPAETAFHDLKTAIANAARLECYDKQQPIEVHTDATATSLGAVLVQAANLRLAVHPGQYRKVIERYHIDLGHAHWKKVLHTLRARFSWPHMHHTIWCQLVDCPKCFAYNNSTKITGEGMTGIPVTKPFDQLCIDFYGPLPQSTGLHKYALIAMDQFSKFLVAIPVPQADTATAIANIHTILQDTWESSSPSTRTAPQSLNPAGCKQHLAHANHPEGNGTCKRAIRTIGPIQAKLAKGDSANWHIHSPTAMAAYNLTPHTSTGATLSKVFLGQDPRMEADNHFGAAPPTAVKTEAVAGYLQQQQLQSLQQANLAKHPTFYPGDMVAVRPCTASTKLHAASRRFCKQRLGLHAPRQYTVSTNACIAIIPAWELQPWGYEKHLKFLRAPAPREPPTETKEHHYTRPHNHSDMADHVCKHLYCTAVRNLTRGPCLLTGANDPTRAQHTPTIDVALDTSCRKKVVAHHINNLNDEERPLQNVSHEQHPWTPDPCWFDPEKKNRQQQPPHHCSYGFPFQTLRCYAQRAPNPGLCDSNDVVGTDADGVVDDGGERGTDVFDPHRAMPATSAGITGIVFCDGPWILNDLPYSNTSCWMFAFKSKLGIHSKETPLEKKLTQECPSYPGDLITRGKMVHDSERGDEKATGGQEEETQHGQTVEEELLKNPRKRPWLDPRHRQRR
ncbi:unnamed protein product [Notodromas monacha]|uniref:RNA-directed DNA polymerase n=1 Tax=Notodromas monacha TaxID=399045 RepID=A0A7R9BY93_9CRUS|nr:unnamed protein product [Notodromas monacha]CAG0922344.1 unnamed protein product [Notodromas monacha]